MTDRRHGRWAASLTAGAVDVRVRVSGKSERIDATHKGRNYSVWLRATFDGKRVRDGYFHYSGPGNCRGTTSWTARRSGR